ncbi:hypothetical protein AMTRI_Chr06g172780 [Amborella trichopoda]
MGGTVEKMVFLSMECDSLERVTKAALPKRVGSCVWVRLGCVPPHFHPPLQEYLILFLGIEAALWCSCFGLWFSKPTI